MKVTGGQARTRPLVSLNSVTEGNVGPSGQAWTSNGSNTAAWASNVGILSSNGSNALLGPYVSVAAGSNMLLTLDAGPGGSVPSNTVRLHGLIKATGQAYTVTNGVADRSYNAASTTTGELANVLGTLIADLKAAGIIS